MNNRIKESFDLIHAEETLKDHTKAFLFQKTRPYSGHKTMRRKYLTAIAACLLLMLFSYGSYQIYFVPTAVISVDINPSLELGVNRFRKVISVDEYNSDGLTLANSLDIKYMDYTDAIDQLLETNYMADLFSQDEVLVITVSGTNEKLRAQMLAELESCTAHHQNTYCHSADSDKTDEAHALGLSCGKYHAFLTLQALNPDITPEEIQGMTMREIYDLITAYSGSEEGTVINDDHHGTGHGHH